MPKQHPNVQDLAEWANVSAATVSRVINGGPDVHPATRARVWRAIEALNYPVLRDSRTLSAIHVVMPVHSQSDYSRQVASGIAAEAQRLDVPILFSREPPAPAHAEGTRRALRRNGVLGVIVNAALPDAIPSLEASIRAARDAVAVWIATALGNRNTVNIDTASAAHAATRRLIALGHRRIALVVQSQERWHDLERLRGFARAIDAAGVGATCRAFVRPAVNRAWLRGLLAGTEAPTALIAGSAMLADALFEALRELGVRLPDDLSFVGFGHLFGEAHCAHDTLAQPTTEMGAEAVRRLAAEVQKPQAEWRAVQLDVTYIDAGTIAAPRRQ